MARRLVALAVMLGAVTVAMTTTVWTQADLLARARALHAQVPLVDGHNDYPWALRELDPARDLARADITGRSRSS